MGGELKFEISQNAYTKLVLHALKHKTSAINGVLLGRVSSSNDVVEITDSVPLFHSNIGLLPQLEISLILIEEYYAAKGVNIVGYFHANERFDDYELSGVAKNIGDHIHRYFPQAPILLLDNKKLEALRKNKELSPVMQLYIKDASKNWKLVGSDGSSKLTIKEPATNIVLLDHISTEKWQDIVDFDDHLDDISNSMAQIIWTKTSHFTGAEVLPKFQAPYKTGKSLTFIPGAMGQSANGQWSSLARLHTIVDQYCLWIAP